MPIDSNILLIVFFCMGRPCICVIIAAISCLFDVAAPVFGELAHVRSFVPTLLHLCSFPGDENWEASFMSLLLGLN